MAMMPVTIPLLWEATWPQPRTPVLPCFTSSKDYLKTDFSQQVPGRDAVTSTGTCPSQIISHCSLWVMGRALKSLCSAARIPSGDKPQLVCLTTADRQPLLVLELGNWRPTARKDPGSGSSCSPCQAVAAAHTPSKPCTPGNRTPLQKEKRKRLQRHRIAPATSIQLQQGVPARDWGAMSRWRGGGQDAAGAALPPRGQGILPAMGSSNSPPPSATEYRETVSPQRQKSPSHLQTPPAKELSNSHPGALQRTWTLSFGIGLGDFG